MRAFVTGGTGFIGCALTRRLLQDGWRVTCLSRDARTAAAPGVESYSFDLMRADSLAFDTRFVDRFDAVFHSAALMPGAKPSSEADFIKANASATVRLLEAAQRGGVTRFVYLSSISVIGAPRQIPVREDHPLAPPLTYSLGKLGGEMACAIARSKGVNAVALRLASPYGLGMATTTVLPSFVATALAGKTLRWHGSGSRSQDFIHVDDVVSACLAAAKADAPLPLYNLASGTDTSMRRLAELVASLAPNSRAEASCASDAQEGVCWKIDVSAAKRDLGFSASIALEDGVARHMADVASQTRPWTWW
jgi:UDP-glucose 4-epimerase